jgi:hypothetical protein
LKIKKNTKYILDACHRHILEARSVQLNRFKDQRHLKEPGVDIFERGSAGDARHFYCRIIIGANSSQ